MIVPGGGRFLMNEVTLYTRDTVMGHARLAVGPLQGYLAHKKPLEVGPGVAVGRP